MRTYTNGLHVVALLIASQKTLMYVRKGVLSVWLSERSPVVINQSIKVSIIVRTFQSTESYSLIPGVSQ